jgi:hypothetical protein
VREEILDSARSLRTEHESLPTAEEVSGMREMIDRQSKTISDQQSELAELAHRSEVSNQDLEDLKSDLSRVEGESDFAKEQLRDIRDTLHFDRFLKELIGRLDRKQQQLEQEMAGKSGDERLAIQKKLADIQRQKVAAQKELDLLKSATFSDGLPNGSLTEADALMGEPSWEELSDRILELEGERARLQRSIEDERGLCVEKLRDAKMATIEEYEKIVDHLKRTCAEQKATIDALTKGARHRLSTS